MKHRDRGYKPGPGLGPGIWPNVYFRGSVPFTLPLPRSVSSPYWEPRTGREVRRR